MHAPGLVDGVLISTAMVLIVAGVVRLVLLVRPTRCTCRWVPPPRLSFLLRNRPDLLDVRERPGRLCIPTIGIL
jgi:hypothetical protein